MVELEIPNDITLTVDGHSVTVKGPKGEVKRLFSDLVMFDVHDKKRDDGTSVKFLTISVPKNAKVKSFALENTVKSHISNMFRGVLEGYSKKLKVIYAHFPFTMEKKNNMIIIKNFLGEKIPRHAKISENVDVKLSKSEVILTSLDKEAIGQTYASLKIATKIKDKDPRIFQDGLYEVK